MSGGRTDRKRQVWWWAAAAIAVVLAGMAAWAWVAVKRAGPILKARVVETLSTRFNSRVELDALDVSLANGMEVSGHGLRIFPADEVVAGGAVDPLITLNNFRFHAPLRSLWERPMHVGTVQVSGMTIHVPPKEARRAGASGGRHGGRITVLADRIVVESSRLILGTAKPDRAPKQFDLQRIVLDDVGPDKPWKYDATLVNAVPRGNIRAHGYFGPWKNDAPGESSVQGEYTFDHADLNTIKGIGGTLSSTGGFDGQLDRIAAHGTTDTPDFSLDTAHHAMPLKTTFQAVIDGTNGDTYLQEVRARLGGTDFVCSGSVVSVKGKGHITELDVNVPDGQVRDFLLLAVKTRPPVMQSRIGMKVHLRVPYGKESVTHKLEMDGAFTLRAIHFMNPKVQDKVDQLSERAQGRPENAGAGAPDVTSEMRGRLISRNGQLEFPTLDYTVPGAEVKLQGVYSMDGNRFDFSGKVRTQAKISQMIASRWKSFLLKAVDPFFQHNGAGAEIPVKITGTQDEPHFRLDLNQRTPEERRERRRRTRRDSGVVTQ